MRPVLRPVSRACLLLAAIMAILPISSPAVTPVPPPEQRLAGYKNHKRVLLVFTPASTDARFQAQQKQWAGEQGAFADYDLVVVPAFTAEKANAPLAERYGIKPGSFAVLLIGKDGNEAFRSEKPVEAKEIYRRIDAMPMRRAEVRERAR